MRTNIQCGCRISSLGYDAEICFLGSTCYKLKPHLISNPGRTQGLVDESLPGPQVLSPTPHSRAAGWIITRGHRFLCRSNKLHGKNMNELNSMATMWTSDTYRTHWNASFASRTDPFTYIAAVDNVQTESAKSLEKLKWKFIFYLILYNKSTTQLSLLTH